MSVCSSQGHKYVVQAEVLYKSWELDESQLAFIQMLQDLEKNEMRGTCFRQSQIPHPTVSYNPNLQVVGLILIFIPKYQHKSV